MIGALIYDVARRGTLSVIDAAKRLAKVQVNFGVDDDRFAEFFQQYGFVSRPRAGAEAVGLSIGGGTIVIAIDDRRYRLTTLADGEVALYDHLGSTILLQANGNIVINAASVVELGDGATKGVARTGDTVTIDATSDPSFIAWVEAVCVAINAVAPNTFGTVPPAAMEIPTAVTAKVTSASSTIKAVD